MVATLLVDSDCPRGNTGLLTGGLLLAIVGLKVTVRVALLDCPGRGGVFEDDINGVFSDDSGTSDAADAIVAGFDVGDTPNEWPWG